MSATENFNILIACPGDVVTEGFKSAAEDVIREIDQWKPFLNVIPRHWERSSYPDASFDGQDAINQQLVNGASMGIAIFFKRLGTPSHDFPCGTDEEINILLQSGKKVQIYFFDGEVDDNLEGYRSQTMDCKSVALYKDIIDFKDKLRNHLMLCFCDMERNAQEIRQPPQNKEDLINGILELTSSLNGGNNE